MPPESTFRQANPVAGWLENGDRRSQADFRHLRLSCHDGEDFELIWGEVFRTTPCVARDPDVLPLLAGVFRPYRDATRGIALERHPTTILGVDTEVRPVLLLLYSSAAGGSSRYDEEGNVTGPPEMVVEVANSTRSLEMHAKLWAYRESGVREYLVLCVEEREIHWSHFPSKRELKPDKAGVWKSRVFPGLWVDGPALFDEDAAKLVETVRLGLASPQHAAFVRRLEARKRRAAP